ncbi:unnamed protein product [Caenorhabditis brenneri]
MLRLWIFLCAIVALTVGYGYDYDFGSQDYGSKEECRKLKHYDVDSSNDGHLSRKAKFTHLERHGKHYTMITCPNDSFMYSLVAEHEGSVFNIFGSNYQDTVVLAAGYNVGGVAKCDGKRTTVVTTDGKKIKIKKVACVQSTGKVSATPTTTMATTTVNPCTLCDIQTIKPSSTPSGIIFEEKETTKPGECKQYEVTCKRDDTQVCTEVSISAPTVMGNSQMGYQTGSGLTQTSVTVDCQTDGSWKGGFETILSQMQCKFVGCAEPPSCTDCQFDNIKPSSTPDGTLFEYKPIENECTKYQITCKRTDGQVCSSTRIRAAVVGGYVTVSADDDVSTTTTVITCTGGGTWGGNEISGLECVFDGCAPPVSCTDCKINTITPVSTPDGSIFESSEIAGSCKKYTVTCKRTDNQVCTGVVLKAQTAIGPATIASATASGVTQTSTTVDCQADGTWASGIVGFIIGPLECSFTGCAPPPSCSNCPIAFLEPTTSIPGVTYNAIETTPSGGGCRRYQLVCARSDNQMCTEVSISALTARGNQMFGFKSGSGLTEATITVECQTNGNWKSGDITLLSNVQCEFVGCAPPPSCTNCDINSIKPISTPSGSVYEPIEITAPGGCKKYTVTCKRTDNQDCKEASVYAPTARGNARIGVTLGGSQASATVECQTNGGWKFGDTAITSNLYCEFVGCAPPPSCTNCDINSIEPISTPSGIVYEAGETTAPGGCKKYTVTCKRADNQACKEVAISAPTANGNQLFGYQAGSGLTQAKMAVECQTDGNWKSGDITILSNVQCEFIGCAPPPSCNSCDINTITPSSLPVGTEFIPTIIPGACVQYGMVCKRTDNQVCSSVKIRAANIYATSSAGTVIAAQNSGTTTSSTAQCSANGVWVVGGLSPVNRLDCLFEGCAVPPSCTTCDFNMLKPLSTPDGVIFEEDEMVGSCNKYRLTCKRIDGKVCTQAYILAIADWGGRTLLGYKIGSGLTETTYTLECRADGKWEGLGE